MLHTTQSNRWRVCCTLLHTTTESMLRAVTEYRGPFAHVSLPSLVAFLLLLRTTNLAVLGCIYREAMR